MDPRSKLAFLLALMALVLGCASADKRAPASPPMHGNAMMRVDADARTKTDEVHTVQQTGRTRSPSEAPASRPAKEREFTLSVQAVPGAMAERDGDGVPDMRIADSSGSAGPPPPAPPPPPPGTPAPGQPQGGQGKGGEAPKDAPRAAPQGPHDAQMIIYTGHLTIAVYQVESALTAVEKVAKDHGGYLQTRADKEITIRVPREKFEAALLAIEKTGDVLHRDVAAHDVTDEFTDLDIRIRNARAMRDRFAKLLEKASVKEAIEIEKELGRVTQELELLEGKIKLLQDRIAYSTITVTYNGRGSSIVPTSLRLPFPWLHRLGLPQLLQLHEDR